MSPNNGFYRTRRNRSTKITWTQRLTDNEELALAILLWKFLRANYSSRLRLEKWDITIEHEQAAYKAIDLAKKAGVKKEFLELMMKVPVTDIKCRELEEWETSVTTETRRNGLKPDTTTPAAKKRKKPVAWARHDKKGQWRRKHKGTSSPSPNESKSKSTAG